MKKTQTMLFGSFSLLLFLLSIILLILNIKVPEYGGDEVWFAMNLLNKRIADLSLFEFVYSGPIKTIVTYFVFNTFGFNIYSVRLFSISVYVLGVVAWSFYLSKQKLSIALASGLILFSLNADLLFFAKVDINQPTFHNMFFILHIILFLIIIRNSPNVLTGTMFIVFAFIESNLHIRNIWIMNAFVLSFILDYLLFTSNNPTCLKAIKQFLSKAWPIMSGWVVSLTYFLYTLIHFRSDPLVLMATANDKNTTYFQSISRSLQNLCDYIVGGRVFSYGYSNTTEALMITFTGFIFFILIIILFVRLFRDKRRSDHEWYFRMLIAMIVISITIFIQYSVTKSSIQPWHGNHVMLLSLILFALVIEGLFLINLKAIAWILLVSISVVLFTIQCGLSKQVTTINENKRGFNLVVWQPISLTSLRNYIVDNPDTYLIADWEIGRPLILENHYSDLIASKLEFSTSPLSNEVINDLSGKLIIRSTEITLTVPDWSDSELIKYNAKFEKIKDFKDNYNREVYQLGYIRKIEQ